MFNKKDKIKKKKTIKRRILKIILWVVGIFAVAIIIFLIWFSYKFSSVFSVPTRFDKFWGKMTDPCYEVYDNSSVCTNDWPNYEIGNDRVCVYVRLSSWGGDFEGMKKISVRGADPKTFEELKCNYGKDKDNVYYYDQKVQGADPNTFEIIDCVFSKDKNHKYSFGKMVK